MRYVYTENTTRKGNKMNITHAELETMFTEQGLTQAFQAWEAAGIKCDIEHTGGNIWCLVAELDNGMTAVMSEDGFSIFTNEDWNVWIKATEEVYADDHDAQIDWIRKVQNSATTFELNG